MSASDIDQPDSSGRYALRRSLNTFGPVLGLAGVYFLFVYIGPESFFAQRTVQTIARQTAIVGAAALGMTLIIIAGGIDLSVGSVVAFSSVVTAWLLRETFGGLMPEPAAWYEMYLYPLAFALAGIAAGALCGLVSGGLITGLRVAPFIVTLGMMLVVRGVATGVADQAKVMAPESWLNEVLATSGPQLEWSTPVMTLLIVSWVVAGATILVASVCTLVKLSRPERDAPLPARRWGELLAALAWTVLLAAVVWLARRGLSNSLGCWRGMESSAVRYLTAVGAVVAAVVLAACAVVLFRRTCRVGAGWSSAPKLLMLTLAGLIFLAVYVQVAWLVRPWTRGTYAGYVETERKYQAALFAGGMAALALVILGAGAVLLKLLWRGVSRWRPGNEAIVAARAVVVAAAALLYIGIAWALWYTHTWPVGIWLVGVLALLLAGVLRYTRFGRHVFAIGSSELTARLCGVPVERVKIGVFALGGLFAGLAGLLQFSRLNVGDPTVAQGLELQVIAAVVIGGGSLSGGDGSILGTVVGALIMGVIRSGCSQMGLENWVQSTITGVIIIIAVALDRLRHRRAA